MANTDYPPVYGLWTNKGGVGKTTLAFHLSTAYAALYPEKTVIVIDMCPPCNISSSLLTYTEGGKRVDGSGVVEKLSDVQTGQIETEDGPYARTIGGYLENMTESGVTRMTDDQIKQLLIKVSDTNKYMPTNMFLVCGDTCLDSMSKVINDRADEEPKEKKPHPYVTIHNLVRTLIKKLAQGIRKESPGKEVVVFVDTNPAMSVYTCLALCAMTDLIIPVNADAFSVQAVKSMFHQVYYLFPRGGRADYFEKKNFAHKARDGPTKLELPRVNCIVHNRAPIYSAKAAAGNAIAPAAFGSLSDEQAALLHAGYEHAQQKNELYRVFKPTTDVVSVSNLHSFKQQYTITMRDMTSCGIASTHSGIPLWLLNEKKDCLAKAYKKIRMLATLPSLIEDLKNLMKRVFGDLKGADSSMLARLNNAAPAAAAAPTPSPTADVTRTAEDETPNGNKKRKGGGTPKTPARAKAVKT